MDMLYELIGYMVFSLWFAGMIILFISQQKESIIHKEDIYPKDVNLFFRPMGLKIKELKRVHDSVKDDVIKSKIAQVIYLRKLGFSFMLAVPLLLVVQMLMSSILK